jgi:hypothetical protein
MTAKKPAAQPATAVAAAAWSFTAEPSAGTAALAAALPARGPLLHVRCKQRARAGRPTCASYCADGCGFR